MKSENNFEYSLKNVTECLEHEGIDISGIELTITEHMDGSCDFTFHVESRQEKEG